MMDDYQKKELSKFNMSQLILVRIDTILTKAAAYYRQGDIEHWYHELKNCKHQIIGRFKPEERKEFQEMELKIEAALPALVLARKRYKIVKMIEAYTEKLQLTIEKKNIGLVAKEDETIFS